MLCLTSASFAQNSPLFEWVDTSQIGGVTISEGELNFVDTIYTVPGVSDIDFIQINNAIAIQDSGRLTFSFPIGESTDTLTAYALDVHYESDSNYIWKGEIPSHNGGIMIVQQEEGAGGFVYFDTIYHEIVPLNKEVSLLTHHNDNVEVPDTLCGVGSIEGDSTITTSNDCIGDGCAALITILVLLPQDAQNWLVHTNRRNIFLTTMVEKLNYAFQNSNISHRARVVYEEFDWNYPGNNNIAQDATLLAEDPVAISLRQAYNADIVIMLTNYVYVNNGNKGAVTKSVFLYGPNSEGSFGISQLTYASWQYNNFVHEVGHLFGAWHESAPNHYPIDCGRAWIIFPNFYYTIMSGGNINVIKHRVPVLHYSDPEINYMSWPTGSVDPPANNAGLIRENGCMVAGYFGDQQFVVLIEGNNRLCEDDEVYTAVVTPPLPGNPGQGPYTYEWRWNHDGIFDAANPGTLLTANPGNPDQVTLPPPTLTGCTFFFIQVKVTSSDNVVSYATKRIGTPCAPCDPAAATPQNRLVNETASGNTFSLSLSPNPNTSDRLELVIENGQAQEVGVSLYSLSGQKLMDGAYLLKEGTNQITLPLNGQLSEGVYLLNIRTLKATISRKVVILK